MPTLVVDAVLFDMDGTLIDSNPGVLLAWDTFGREYGFDGAAAAFATHGRRLHDTLEHWCKITDPESLEKEIIRFETEVLEGGPIQLPGTMSLLNQIIEGSTPTAPGWTIVTSATGLYASKALPRTGVPIPRAGYITSDDVQRGKPAPDPYLAGAQRVGADPARCVVIEDAPNGMKAGRAAGAKTIALCTSETRDGIVASGAEPDFIVKDLSKISARWEEGRLVLDIDDSLW